MAHVTRKWLKTSWWRQQPNDKYIWFLFGFFRNPTLDHLHSTNAIIGQTIQLNRQNQRFGKIKCVFANLSFEYEISYSNHAKEMKKGRTICIEKSKKIARCVWAFAPSNIWFDLLSLLYFLERNLNATQR